jgi:hypothetical protein
MCLVKAPKIQQVAATTEVAPVEAPPPPVSAPPISSPQNDNRVARDIDLERRLRLVQSGSAADILTNPLGLSGLKLGAAGKLGG